MSLEDRYFPTKQYGDLTFPPGTYRALCVEIGKSEGRNWWCVLFPCLCFVDETTAVVPENSKQKLKQHITTEEYNRLTATSSPASKKKRHRLLPRSRFTPASMTGLPLTSQIGVETNSLALRICDIISLREKQGGYFLDNNVVLTLRMEQLDSEDGDGIINTYPANTVKSVTGMYFLRRDRLLRPWRPHQKPS